MEVLFAHISIQTLKYICEGIWIVRVKTRATVQDGSSPVTVFNRRRGACDRTLQHEHCDCTSAVGNLTYTVALSIELSRAPYVWTWKSAQRKWVSFISPRAFSKRLSLTSCGVHNHLWAFIQSGRTNEKWQKKEKVQDSVQYFLLLSEETTSPISHCEGYNFWCL